MILELSSPATMKRLSGGNFVYGNPCLELEIIDGTEIRLLVVLFFSAFH